MEEKNIPEQEPGEIILRFGIHKGKKLSEVSREYLTYLYDRKMVSGKLKKAIEEIVPYLKKQ